MKCLSGLLILSVVISNVGCSGSSSGGGGGNAAQGGGGSIYGAYYTPKIDQAGGQNPEKLDIISENSLVTYTVFNDRTIVSNSPFSVQGNQITTPAADIPQASYDCGGPSVSYSASSSPQMTFTFEKADGVLTIHHEDTKITFKEATPEQRKKIENLPKCTKN